MIFVVEAIGAASSGWRARATRPVDGSIRIAEGAETRGRRGGRGARRRGVRDGDRPGERPRRHEGEQGQAPHERELDLLPRR